MAPGNRLLLTVHLRGEVDGQRVDIVENSRRTPLSSDDDVWVPQFVLPNHLLFVRRQTNPGVWVVPFDGGALDLTRASMVQPGAGAFDAARDGTLVVRFLPKERRDLVWVTRSGTMTPVPGRALEMTAGAFGLAPDGGRALMSVLGPDFREEIVVRDLATGTDTRVPAPRPVSAMTSGATVSWAPGGRLFFGVGGVETSEIFDWPADGSTGGRKLVAGTSARMVAGRPEIYFTRDERGVWRLRRAALRSDGTVETPEPVFPGNAEPMVRGSTCRRMGGCWRSRTGSGDMQQHNVFVTTLPDLRERRQVTSSGGVRPKFSRDGKELFYFSGTRTGGSTRGQLNAVSLAMNPLTIGAPSVVLVEDPARGRRSRRSTWRRTDGC